ncbi:hypothetical protein MBLNU13_g05174t1 [Cladosporium sp. NU13]
MTVQGCLPNTPPVDLVHAARGELSSDYNKLPEGGCHKLLSLGRRGKGDYTWGYRIYRTTYHKPNSDANFAKAIGQRARHEIVEDSELLEGAAESPEKMLKIHQDWVHSHPGARVPHHSFHRYFLVVDDEVMNHLLQLSTPAKYETTIPVGYAIKLFDAWFNMDWDFYGDSSEPEPEEDEDMSDEEEEREEIIRADDFIGYEGWFWIGVFHLVSFWMCEDKAAVEELPTSDKYWGDKRRPVRVRTLFPPVEP